MLTPPLQNTVRLLKPSPQVTEHCKLKIIIIIMRVVRSDKRRGREYDAVVVDDLSVATNRLLTLNIC